MIDDTADENPRFRWLCQATGGAIFDVGTLAPASANCPACRALLDQVAGQ
jgi:hypothetical protein